MTEQASQCRHDFVAQARAMKEGNCPCCQLIEMDRLYVRATRAEALARNLVDAVSEYGQCDGCGVVYPEEHTIACGKRKPS